MRLIYEIAKDIRSDWKNVNYAAEPYLKAMEEMEDINEAYYCDSGVDVVLRFLCNANTWRGEVAKGIKKELKSMVKY